MDIAERIKCAFRNGDLILNLNSPAEWEGGIETVPLGARWYHGATQLSDDGRFFTVGAASIEDEPLPRTDCSRFDGRKSGDFTDGHFATIASTKRSRFNIASRFGRRY